MTDFDLKGEFLETARWRKEKAAEYPDDGRNELAVKLLTALAADADNVSEALEREFQSAYEQSYFARHPDDNDYDDEGISAWGERLRNIGFGYEPKTAEEFVRDAINLFSAHQDGAA